MKAIRVEEFGAPEVMQLVEVPDLQPTANQILVRLHAAGVNPVETYIRSGNYAAKPSLPYTPGSDGAGVIEHSSGGFSKGERVFLAGSITGTYAKLALCTPEQVFRLPEDISFEQGAALGVPYGTAHRALFERGQGRAGARVVSDAPGRREDIVS